MNESELNEMVDDVGTFLKDLQRILPNKVDPELLRFMDTVKDSSWLVDLLLNSINQSKQLEGTRRR